MRVSKQRVVVRPASARWLRVASVLAVMVTLASPAVAHPNASSANGVDPPARPNILLLVADDQSWNTFNRALMPNVYASLVDRGMLFDRAYVDAALCCPSRSQLMTGLDEKHTGVDSNGMPLLRPTIVQALHDLGYRTGLAGKYLNSEPCDPQPGFDDWHCTGSPPSNYAYTDPLVDDNGTWVQHQGYTTDILAEDVATFIQGTPDGQPWFAMYVPTSPHLPANDPRCTAPVPPLRDTAYDEDTVADGKPKYMQRPPLTPEEVATIDRQYQSMTDAVQCLDGSMKTVLDAVDASTVTEANTIVVYLSDNGVLYGEHRRSSKSVPYEEAVRVPMVVRAPMLHDESQPAVTEALVQNTDIAPTIADLLGVHWGADGVSLAPLLTGQATSVRDGALIADCEGATNPCAAGVAKSGEDAASGIPSFFGVVTSQYKYVEYNTGERELYDFAADPYELANLAGTAPYAEVQADLAAQLQGLVAPPPVDTTVVTGPAAALDERVAAFTYFSQDRRATYRCRLSRDGSVVRDWSPCNGQGVTEGGLGDGDYVFEVAGTDSFGNQDPTPDSRSFSVSSTGPDADIPSHPAEAQQSGTLSFGFGSQTADVTFDCALQPLGGQPVFIPCDPASGITYGPLADGDWDFQVRATDPSSGLTTSPPAEWLTHVDNAGPRIIFDVPSGASGYTQASTTFKADFHSDEPTVGDVTCTMDGAPLGCALQHVSLTRLRQGLHSLAVTATDAVGNVGVTTFTFTVDTRAPIVSITSGPADPTNLTSARFTFSANETATFTCALDGGSSAVCASPKSYLGLPEGAHTFCVVGTDSAGNQAPSVCRVWTIDRTAPAVVITSGPAALTNQPPATFVFTADEPVTYRCSLDGGGATDCASPAVYTVAEGPHTLTIKATDLAGNRSVAAWSWTLDATAPTVSITSAPSSITNQSSATVDFVSPDPSATFTCSLDSGASTPCAGPTVLSGLADGAHSFVVTPTDPAGNVGPSAQASWTVDTLAPMPTIDDGPESITNETSATFGFSVDDPAATITCALDGAAPEPCASPVTVAPIAEGPHAYVVAATDLAGNSASATWTWTVDLTAPIVTVASGPPALTRQRRATFTFDASESVAAYACSVDGNAFVACSNPFTFTTAGGDHTLAVEGTDAAGNVGGPSPPYTWSVDTTRPTATITSGPADPTNQRTSTFAFTSDDPTATPSCKLGAKTYACSGQITFSGVSAGRHTFVVRYTDPAGNVGQATYAWTVDVTAPAASFTSTPPDPSGSTVTFGFTADEPATFACSLDGEPAAPCSSGVSYEGLAAGAHTFNVTPTDAAGNAGVPISYSWSVQAERPSPGVRRV